MRAKLLIFIPIAVLITVLDLYTKQRITSHLSLYEMHEVIPGVFWLANHQNTGGMWGIGQDWNPWVLRVVRIGAVAVIFLILLQTASKDRLGLVALGLVLGGAVGNIYDSLTLGHVRDFLRFDFGFPPFHPFPTFNVADSAICIGVALLALQMLRAAPDAPKEPVAESNGS